MVVDDGGVETEAGAGVATVVVVLLVVVVVVVVVVAVVVVDGAVVVDIADAGLSVSVSGDVGSRTWGSW